MNKILKFPKSFKYPKSTKSKGKLYYRKNKLKLKNNQYFFNVSQKSNTYPNIWNNIWDNLHLQYKSLLISKLINKFMIERGMYVSKYYIHMHHNGIKIVANSLGIFKEHNARKNIKKYRKKLKNKKLLSNLAKLLLIINNVTYVKLSFYQRYLPKYLIQKNVVKVFKKNKRDRFFWESLQLVYAVFKGYASASILGSLIYMHTRRNPKRLKFIAYIKRLLDWHFHSVSILRVQGVRLEVKGRFNPKSRAKKHIISTGRVGIHEKSSNVDYARIIAITKFGCLGIKVWVCPKNF